MVVSVGHECEDGVARFGGSGRRSSCEDGVSGLGGLAAELPETEPDELELLLEVATATSPSTL